MYNLLDGPFTTWVVNPAHIKNVPGRKTDVNDSTWIANLLRHGLLRPSFIPVRPQRKLRQRTQWTAERSRDVNRTQRVLEGTNIKLPPWRLATDVLGVSGRAMIQQLIAGETDPVRLAGLPVGRPKARRAALTNAT